jgi:hypothetical protein
MKFSLYLSNFAHSARRTTAGTGLKPAPVIILWHILPLGLGGTISLSRHL